MRQGNKDSPASYNANYPCGLSGGKHAKQYFKKNSARLNSVFNEPNNKVNK